MKWPFCSYCIPVPSLGVTIAKGNTLGMHGKTWQAGGGEVEAILIHSSKVTSCPPRRRVASHFLFDRTFPREWTPPSDPAGRKRGGCSRSSDTMEREEGVTAIEVTQWLELQDTSGEQEGRGSSKPWNPDLLNEASNTAALLEPREQTASNRSYRDTWFW